MRRSTFLSSLNALRAPLGALAMLFVVANLLIPTTMARAALEQGGAWQVVCSQFSINIDDGEAAAIAKCKDCCLTSASLTPQPTTHLVWPADAGMVHIVTNAPVLTAKISTQTGIGSRAPPTKR